jgi:hypothetical protein
VEATTTTLVGEMLALRSDGRSGVLLVAAEGAPTSIYYVGGKMVFAEKGKLADSFGRVLMESGWLASEAFAQAVSRMKERPFHSEQWRFSEVVVELGLMTPEQIRDALALHVQERIVDCLMLENARWSFRDREDPVDRAARFPMKLEPLVFAATTRLDRNGLDGILGPARRYVLKLTDAPEAIAARFEFSGADQRILDHIDGQRSMADLAALDPNAGALVAALVLLACVERTEAKSSKPVAAPAVIPPVVIPPVIVASVVPPARVSSLPPGPDADPRTVAESAFRRAKRRLFEGDPQAALPHLRQAVGLLPASLEFDLCLRWAESRAGGQPLGGEEYVRTELWELAVKAVKEEPKMAFGHYVMGFFAKERADNKRAFAMFRRAAELDANFIDAARQAHILSRS